MIALIKQPYQSLVPIFHSHPPMLTLIRHTPFQDIINLGSDTKTITPHYRSITVQLLIIYLIIIDKPAD